MFKILQISDNVDNSCMFDPSKLTGDAIADMSLPYVRQFVAGSGVTIGADGYVKLATDDDTTIGFTMLDAWGIAFENTPALASGILAAVTGGMAETDNVDGDVVNGARLYVKDGKVTATAPTATARAMGICTVGNTVAGGAIEYRFSTAY